MARNQMREPARRDVIDPTIDAAMPPLRNDKRSLCADEMRRQLAEIGLVTDEGDSWATGHLGELGHHGCRRMPGRERIQRLHDGLAVDARRQEIGRLPRAHQRAGEDLVDRHVQAFQPTHDFLESVDTALGQRPLGVVRPLVAALGGYGVAHQVEFHGSIEV